MVELTKEEINFLNYLNNNSSQLYELSEKRQKLLPRLVSLNLVNILQGIIYCVSSDGREVLEEYNNPRKATYTEEEYNSQKDLANWANVDKPKAYTITEDELYRKHAIEEIEMLKMERERYRKLILLQGALLDHLSSTLFFSEQKPNILDLKAAFYQYNLEYERVMKESKIILGEYLPKESLTTREKDYKRKWRNYFSAVKSDFKPWFF